MAIKIAKAVAAAQIMALRLSNAEQAAAMRDLMSAETVDAVASIVTDAILLADERERERESV